MIIERKETKKLKLQRNWIFLFGRRKTGKSFLAKNFINWDEYFFIKRDKAILSEKEGLLGYETFLNILKRQLKNDKIIVVDEFHRLGDDFLDIIHSLERNGKLIVISSTLFLSKQLLGKRSPILGLFAEMPLKIISLDDTLKALNKLKLDLSKKELLENAILLREPITVMSFDKNQKARNTFSEVILGSIKTVPALVGEIFLEEEKTLSAVYEGILRAIAVGKTVSTEIANYLFSKKLIINNDASIVQQYLKNLIEFGIIKRIQVYNRKKFIYKHISPLVSLFYYADEKYNVSEREVTEKEIIRIIDEVMPKIVEDNIRELFAIKYGFIETIVETKDYDIDAYLLKFKKPEMAIEIKWKRKVSKEDIAKAEKNLEKIDAKRKILFVADKSLVHSKLETLDISDL
ncbi:MAG: AAA family ATPase [Candidatus Woesearchaeota archaeon]